MILLGYDTIDINLVSLTEPYRVFGEGDYALSDVREIEGSHEYLQLAEERRLCNRTQFEECAAAEYIEEGLTRCNCTPYHLREASLSKRKNFGKISKQGIKKKISMKEEEKHIIYDFLDVCPRSSSSKMCSI